MLYRTDLAMCYDVHLETFNKMIKEVELDKEIPNFFKPKRRFYPEQIRLIELKLGKIPKRSLLTQE